ncbi:MAG: beta-lactamase family protein [Caulobacteraceae bacterium]|nr:beta-lactamase family protein [Caulobacteraceae bacterium]
MSKAARLGFSQERLERIGTFLNERYIAPGRLPGAQLLIARRGEIAHELLVGHKDVERGEPVESDTIFRIYSMTKPITSVAIMMLVEEGLVALDDPVAKFIPEWANLGVFVAGGPQLFQTRPVERPMQVVDLLRHTSGLTYGFQNRGNLDAAYRRAAIADHPGTRTLAETMTELARMPLEFSPGEAWNYSISTDVLGYLVEAISGQPFAAFLKDRLFDPLGMGDTGFFVPPEKAARFAACYDTTPSQKLSLQDDPQTSAYLKPPVFYSGGGGLVSTAADYMKFAGMLLTGEANGHRFLSPSTIRLMTSNHLPDGQDLTELSRSLFSESTNAGVGFGLGFAVTFDPVKAMLPSSPGEFYWGGAASTAFWVDPVEEVTVVFMTQLLPSSTYPIRRQLRTLVYAALTEP